MNLNTKLGIKYHLLLCFLAISLLFVTYSSAEEDSSPTAKGQEEITCETLKCLSPVLKVYFSRSELDIRAPLIEAIKGAKKSIYAYFYQCNDELVQNTLVEAKNRGVDVRFITDAHYYHKEDYYGAFYGPLEEAGIEVITEEKGGKKDENLHAHNKFAVIDEKILWTGSYNITVNGRENNNNNAVWISDEDLAKTYLMEFNQIWGTKSVETEREPSFGNKKKELVSSPKKQISNISNLRIESFFSPVDHSRALRAALMNAIASADYSIYFAAFVFTDKELMDAIAAKAKEGVEVYGVFNKLGSGSASSVYNTVLSLEVKNVNVYLHDEIDDHATTLNHKFMIVDPDTNSDPLVVTGSSNWTNAAWKENDENTIIIYNDAIAKAFQKEFERLIPDK